MAISTAFPPSQKSAGVGIETKYDAQGASTAQNRPVRIVVLGQGNEGVSYATTKRRITSVAQAGLVYGYGSPIHIVAGILLGPNGVADIPVTVYPLDQPTSGVQAAGSLTPSGTPTKSQTYKFKIGGIQTERVVVASGDTVAEMVTKATAAINAVLRMPVTATDDTTEVGIEVNWEGESGNNVDIEEIDAPDDGEITWTPVQPVSGAGVPDITTALAQMGDKWETHIINCLDYTNSDELDELATFGEGRWDPYVYKPLVSFVGCNEATIATVTAVTDARKTDRTNCVLVNPGSSDLPFTIAAAQVREIAKLANTTVPHDYVNRACPDLTPGTDGVQWDKKTGRPAAFAAGCSTVVVEDGVVKICDTITCYHPTGEDPPAYQYVVDIEKLATMIYRFNAEFNSSKWAGAPMVPDGQASTEPTAKRPSDARAAMNRIYTQAGLDSIISDPKWAKENSRAEISSTNPKRLDISAVFKLAGNVNVISITLNHSFYLGGAA